jgi:ribosomal protein L10
MLKNKTKLEKFSNALGEKSFALMVYKNLTVLDMQKLRRKARENDCNIFVIKNTLSSRLLPEIKDFCKKNTLFAIGNDPLSALNTCTVFAKQLTPLCVSDRKSVITKDCDKLLSMTSMKDMYSKLILTVRSPMVKMLRLLQLHSENLAKSS